MILPHSAVLHKALCVQAAAEIGGAGGSNVHGHMMLARIEINICFSKDLVLKHYVMLSGSKRRKDGD